MALPKTATMSNYMRNIVHLDARTQLNFHGRKWLPAMLDTRHPYRVWMCSRQVGKSANGCGEGLTRSAVIDGFRVLVVMPEQDQAKKFSRDKASEIIKNSPYIARRIEDANNVYEKAFKRGGRYYLKWAKHSPDGIRGISDIDMTHYDEIQDLDLDNIMPIVDQVMFTSDYSLRLLTGTPKSFANQIDKYFRASDQREWMVRCTRHTHKQWNFLGLKNIGKHGPVCAHCGHLLDVDNGAWVKMNPGGIYAGFHVGQMHAKISHKTQDKWNDFLHKYENYKTDKFLNECLGFSADSAEMPLTLRQIKAVSDPELDAKPVPIAKLRTSPFYAGIDWGHGTADTALSIGQFDSNGRFRYVFFARWEDEDCEPEVCIPEILEILHAYNPKRIHCDYGGGFGVNPDIAAAFPGRVTTNMWASSSFAADKNWDVKNHKIPRLQANKTKAFTAFIKSVKKKKIVLPNYAWLENFEHAEHFINIRKEVDARGATRFVKAGNEDLLESAVYARLVAQLDMSGQFD